MSKWDYLDEEYEEYQSWEPIRKNMDPMGSLTDNLRVVKVQRDGAIKRARQLKEQLYNG